MMEDDAGGDEKLLCVPVNKTFPYYSDVVSYKDMPPIVLQQIEHFFSHYKDLEPGKWAKLNGWGDDLVHDYLKAIVLDGRIAVLYSNKDYGCEWDYDFRNKRFLAEDNTKFGVNIVLYALGA